MSFPVGTPTVTLVGKIPSAVAGTAYAGKLVARPSAYLIDSSRHAVYPGGGSVDFASDGSFSIVLLPCDASGIQPVGWRWFLDLQPTGSGAKRIQFYANITGTGTVYFDTLTPVPAPGGGSGGSGGGAVSSVNGMIGAVVLDADDVDADSEGTAAAAVSAHAVATDPHGDRAAAAAALTSHEADTTSVHGIANTAALETQTGAQAKADAAQSAAVSTAAADATTKVASHEADTTGVHGIADTAALETASGATAKVTAHKDALDPHGDRAYADNKFATQISLGALDGYVNDALTRVTAIEQGTAWLAGIKVAGDAVVAGGDLTVSDTSKGYRFRRGGSALDLEATGADLIVSNWSGTGFNGTQHAFLRLASNAQAGQFSGKLEFTDTLYGAVRHTLDGAANTLGLHGATPVVQQTVTGSRADGTALANLLTALSSTGLIANGSIAGLTGQWRRRDLPDPVTADALYAGTAPSVSTAQTTTPTAGYIKYAPAGVTLAGSDVTGPYTYAGAGNFQIGTIAPDPSYVLPLSKFPNTYASGQSTWSVEFGTDAQLCQVRMKYISTATMYRLSIDGRKVTDLMQSSGGTTAGSGHLITFDLGSTGPRRIRLDFSTFPFGGIYFPPTASVWRVPLQGGRFMVFGDSIPDGSSQNTGAGCGTWVDRVGRLSGATDVWRQGRGGTGYITAGSYDTLGNRLAADVVAWAPTRLIVSAGYNDNGGSQPTIAAAAASLYAAIRAGLPGCEVYVIGCWSPTGSPAASITNTDTTLRTAAAAAGYPFISPVTGSCYDSTGALVVTHGPWITGTGRVGATTGSGNADTYIGSDAVHPTDAGHIYLARRITAAIRELMPA